MTHPAFIHLPGASLAGGQWAELWEKKPGRPQGEGGRRGSGWWWGAAAGCGAFRQVGAAAALPPRPLPPPQPEPSQKTAGQSLCTHRLTLCLYILRTFLKMPPPTQDSTELMVLLDQNHWGGEGRAVKGLFISCLFPLRPFLAIHINCPQEEGGTQRSKKLEEG